MKIIKGRIDELGYLEVKREDKFKEVYCPYSKNHLGTNDKCGDWCALFGEIEEYTSANYPYRELTLCSRTVLLEEEVPDIEEEENDSDHYGNFINKL